MRSRYSAFVLGLGSYLFDSLASTHPERALPREATILEFARIREKQRFMRLNVIASSNTRSEGEVLFLAGVFEKGRDHSFVELSRFVREDGHWRYESGIVLPASRVPADPSTLDVASFLALAAADPAP